MCSRICFAATIKRPQSPPWRPGNREAVTLLLATASTRWGLRIPLQTAAGPPASHDLQAAPQRAWAGACPRRPLPSQGLLHSGSCGGRRWRTCGHRQPAWYLRGSPATLYPARPSPSSAGAFCERGRKRGGERARPWGMMGVVVSRYHVARSGGLRLDALGASEAGASRQAPPPFLRHFVSCPGFPRPWGRRGGAEPLPEVRWGNGRRGVQA